MKLYIIEWIDKKYAREIWLTISKEALNKVESTLKAFGIILGDWLPTTKSKQKAFELSKKWLKIYSARKKWGWKKNSPCTMVSEISTDELDKEWEEENDRIIDRMLRQ